MELGGAGWRWMVLGGGGWCWVEVDEAGWRWVHGLVIPFLKDVFYITKYQCITVRTSIKHMF